jgi:tripartite-type tricarboxylate transporter receptor subunit TctC
MPFDVLKDFAPITLAVTTYSLLIAAPTLPVNSVKELIALARSQPGKLNYGALGMGSSYHINGEMFKNMTGTDITAVQYKASSMAMQDLSAGRIDLMFSTGPVSMPFVKAGKVKALGVTSLQPSALAPGIAPIAQSGVPGYEYGALLGLLAPGGTPDSIIRKLNAEIVRFIKSPEARERLLATGVEPVGSTPEEFTAVMKAEMDKYGKIIKAAGIEPK